MAKRKRLTPANPMLLNDEGPAASTTGLGAAPVAHVAGDSSARAALAEVAEEMTLARKEGRLILQIPLDQIDMEYLVRDRVPMHDDDMEALVESLRARGQQAPIEVTPLPDQPDRYGLISGWRRCMALRQLHAEEGNAHSGEVLALLRHPAQSSEAYLAMIEENEIRVGLSFYERARIVQRTVAAGVYDTPSDALNALFATASKAKRSKIRSFISLVDALDGHLRHPRALGERQGLQLSRALSEVPRLAGRLRTALDRADAATPVAEGEVIAEVIAAGKGSSKGKMTKASAVSLGRGVMAKGASGQLVLRGAALTADVQARLIEVLKAELGD